MVHHYKILWFTILWGLYNYNSWCSVFYCRLCFLSTSSWPVDIWNLENRVLRIWPYKYRLTKKTFLVQGRWGSWYIYICIYYSYIYITIIYTYIYTCWFYNICIYFMRLIMGAWGLCFSLLQRLRCFARDPWTQETPQKTIWKEIIHYITFLWSRL
jgi:hypothetical protein